MPSSRKVGTSAKYGSRLGVAFTSRRHLPRCASASDEYDIAPSTWPPRRDETRSPVPLNGTYTVWMLSIWFRRACAAWFAELVPEPARLSVPGLAFAAATNSWNVLNGDSFLTTIASGV